jgi:hypothetical protein
VSSVTELTLLYMYTIIVPELSRALPAAALKCVFCDMARRYRSNGLTWLQSRMFGNSTSHAISGVRIEDFTVNGTLAHALEDLGIVSNQFVRNVSFA